MDLLQLENLVTTQITKRVTDKLYGKYPNLTFTTELDIEDPSFPNVYIHELEPVEISNSIPNDKIHAVRDTIQIEVVTNTSKADGRIVVNACVNAMKEIRYSIIMMPIYQKSNNLHRFVFRARRVVASGDKFSI